MTDLTEVLAQLAAAIESGAAEITITIRQKPPTDPRFEVRCPACAWHRKYTRQDNANAALKKHLRNCPEAKRRAYERIPLWIREISEGKEPSDIKR